MLMYIKNRNNHSLLRIHIIITMRNKLKRRMMVRGENLIDIPEEVIIKITNKILVEEFLKRFHTRWKQKNTELQLMTRQTLESGVVFMSST